MNKRDKLDDGFIQFLDGHSGAGSLANINLFGGGIILKDIVKGLKKAKAQAVLETVLSGGIDAFKNLVENGISQEEKKKLLIAAIGSRSPKIVECLFRIVLSLSARENIIIKFSAVFARVPSQGMIQIVSLRRRRCQASEHILTCYTIRTWV